MEGGDGAHCCYRIYVNYIIPLEEDDWFKKRRLIFNADKRGFVGTRNPTMLTLPMIGQFVVFGRQDYLVAGTT
jgi:hypothetical protein